MVNKDLYDYIVNNSSERIPTPGYSYYLIKGNDLNKVFKNAKIAFAGFDKPNSDMFSYYHEIIEYTDFGINILNFQQDEGIQLADDAYKAFGHNTDIYSINELKQYVNNFANQCLDDSFTWDISFDEFGTNYNDEFDTDKGMLSRIRFYNRDESPESKVPDVPELSITIYAEWDNVNTDENEHPEQGWYNTTALMQHLT